MYEPNTAPPGRTSKPAARARSRHPWPDLAKPLQHRPRDVEIPAGAAAEPDSRLHVAVEVRTAAYAQIEFARQRQILLDIRRPVIAVVHLDRAEAQVPHFGYDSPHPGRIAVAQSDRVGNGRDAACSRN